MGHALRFGVVAACAYLVRCGAPGVPDDRGCSARDVPDGGGALAGVPGFSDHASFVQSFKPHHHRRAGRSALRAKARSIRREPDHSGDLAFVHMPFNFGNTVEMVAMSPDEGTRFERFASFVRAVDGDNIGVARKVMTWDSMGDYTEPGSVLWGHVHPGLQANSTVTGCPLYLTPQKHWPHDVAELYFGNKTVVGILRDPYEKLVAQFRHDNAGYGGTSPHLSKCDVNNGVKQKLKELLAGDNVFMDGCTYVPQAEYYDPPYGITLPVDNFMFPRSMNEALAQHGYSMHIRTEDLIHVSLCNDVWSADFDNETRSLVRQIYARDFELLCKYFGYCDHEENTCIAGVPEMCPDRYFEWADDKKAFCPRTADVNARVNPACLQ